MKGSHRASAFLDFAEEAFDIVVGANRAPVLFGKVIETQAITQIPAQALDCLRDHRLPLEYKGFYLLLSLIFAVGQVEDAVQFVAHVSLLALWHMDQDVFDLVHRTALPDSTGKLGFDCPDDCHTAIGNPQLSAFYPTTLEVIHKAIPCRTALLVPRGKAQHLPFTIHLDPQGS